MEKLIFPITKREAEKRGIKYSSEANKNALFPSRLRELRKERDVSQATLASALGVSKSTIGLYETGDTLPDAKTIYDIAKYFSVSSDYLLGLSDATKQEFHDFAEMTHFSHLTVAHLQTLGGLGCDTLRNRRNRASFEYLFLSNEFDEILALLREYLDTTSIDFPENNNGLIDMYCELDEKISGISDGLLHVVTSPLLAQTLLSKAQRKIQEAFETVKKNIDDVGGWDKLYAQTKTAPSAADHKGSKND